MATKELEKERDEFWGKVHRESAEAFLCENAGRHYDSEPALRAAFAPGFDPSPAQVAAGRERYVASFLKQARDDAARAGLSLLK